MGATSNPWSLRRLDGSALRYRSVPPVCDQCLRRECLRLTPGRSLLLRLFVSSILHLSEDVWFLHLCKIGRLLPQSL